MYVCLIITVKRLDPSVPNFAHRSTLAQRFFFDVFLFISFIFFCFLSGFFVDLKKIGVEGAWDGIVWGGGAEGGEGRGCSTFI